jgi:NTP pyrophosphatase (non-canonical NTP hydrolase)
MSYAKYEMNVIQWATTRGIVQNSNSMAQAIKTMEEVNELLEAIHMGDKKAQKDAYGDILVTLIVGCATADVDLVDCLNIAYGEIKDRKGFLNAQGVFVKDAAC